MSMSSSSRPCHYFCVTTVILSSTFFLSGCQLWAQYCPPICPSLLYRWTRRGSLQQRGWVGGGGSFKDAGGRALLYRGTLVPVTPSFHHQRLPVNPAYINFLPGWQQGCAAAPALPSSYPPPLPTVAPILLFADEPSRLREQTVQIVAAPAVTVGLPQGD